MPWRPAFFWAIVREGVVVEGEANGHGDGAARSGDGDFAPIGCWPGARAKDHRVVQNDRPTRIVHVLNPVVAAERGHPRVRPKRASHVHLLKRDVGREAGKPGAVHVNPQAAIHEIIGGDLWCVGGDGWTGVGAE